MVSAATRINTQRRPHQVFAPHNRTLPCPVFFLYKPRRPTSLCPRDPQHGPQPSQRTAKPFQRNWD